MRKGITTRLDGLLKATARARLGVDFEPAWPETAAMTAGLTSMEVMRLYHEAIACAKDAQIDIESNQDVYFNAGYRDAMLTMAEKILETAGQPLDVPEWVLGGGDAGAGDKGLQAGDRAGEAA